jgi:hypothetical protein
MKTVTRAPAGRPIGAGLTVAQRRRRWPRVVLWIVAVALLADVAGFLVFVSRYQPLETGGPAPVDREQIARLIRATPPGGTAFSQYRVEPLHGSRFWYTFTLSNGGSLPVTVTGVTSAPSDGGPLTQTGVRIGDPGASGRDPAAVLSAFQSFTLGARGGRRMVAIDARIACTPGPPAPSVAYGGTITVAFEVLGFYERRATITLPYTLQVPPGPPCDASPHGAHGR